MKPVCIPCLSALCELELGASKFSLLYRSSALTYSWIYHQTLEVSGKFCSYQSGFLQHQIIFVTLAGCYLSHGVPFSSEEPVISLRVLQKPTHGQTKSGCL